MKRLLLCVVSIILALMSIAQQRSYDDKLQAMQEYPRTVIKEAQVALDVAVREHRSSDMIDALMLLSGARLMLDSDSIMAVVEGVERVMNRCSDKVDRSVIALYLCEVYNTYLANNYHRFAHLSYIKGNSNIATWSVDNFYDAIDSLQRVALQPVRELQRTPISRYAGIIAVDGYEGKHAHRWLYKFYPTMYDFVLSIVYKMTTEHRVHNAQPDADNMESVLCSAIQYHNMRREYAPAMMWNLKYLQYNYLTTNDRESYLRALDEVISRYSRHDFVIEAVIARYGSTLIHTPQEAKAEYNAMMRWIDRYPHYYRTPSLQSMCADLSDASVAISMPQVVYPGDIIVPDVVYSNVDSIECVLWRGDITQPFQDMSRLAHEEVAWHLVEKQTLVCEGVDFEQRSKAMSFTPQSAGVYRITIESGTEKADVTFVVTPYAMLTVESLPNEAQVLLVDGKSGKPVADESVLLTSRNGVVLQQFVTDSLGLCRLQRPSVDGSYYVRLAQTESYPFMHTLYYTREKAEKSNIQAQIFTDRQLYRPGQMVYFSALLYRLDGSLRHVVPDCELQAKLYDNAGNEMWCGAFKTDSYGSVHDSIALPEGAVAGNWRLTVQGDNLYAVQYIEVAEYKRPQFAIECRAIERIYSYGDSVCVEGSAHTYAGVEVAFAQVDYTVRQYAYIYGGGSVVARGTTTTDSEGDFAVSFVAVKPQEEYARWWGTRYVVDIIVTSPTGESRQAEAVVSVAGVGVKFNCDIPNKVCREEAMPFALRIVNGSGVVQQLPYELSLYRMYDKGVATEPIREDVAVWQAHGIGADDKLMLPYKIMSSQAYRLVMTTHTPAGVLVADSVDFVCYSVDDVRPPVSVALWLPQERYEVNNGDTARIAVGSSLPDATVYYFISDADTPVEYGVIELSNSITHIALPYDAQSADVVQVELVIVHGMQVHRKHVAVCRKQSDMRLTITPITFRDKTTPGSRETWRFVVRDANGNPLNALFMAELYDASLDALRPHSWHFNPRFTPQPLYPISVDYLWCMTSTDYASLNYRNDFVSACFVAGVEPMLRDYLLSYYGFMGGGRLYRSVAQVGAQELVAKNGVQADMISVEESSADVSYQLADEHSSPNPTTTTLQAIEYRDDMQETAFFYPHLVTDSEGNVSVEFTLPESNTTWNFLSLAVTPQLQNGMYTASVVSSKPLMVQPNMPRFARQGDVLALPIALYNTTDEAMQGQVKMTLYNPTNEHEIMALSEPFSLQAQASTMVQFSVTVPDTLSLVGVRVGATTSLYSDGEQHLLPLLPSTTVVTESKPFYVAPTVCDTTITFDAMREKLDDSGVQNLRLTLEYCDNPTWYAVTALPSLAQTSDRGAISVMASLYAHVVAAGIVAQNPAIAHALSWWRNHADDEALVSPLMQNEELKQLILSETPWLLEATTSTEQLQQIALLLDTNRAQYLGGEAVARLSDMQQSDGGWPWIKGMQSSFTITLNVVAGLSRLMQWGDMGNTDPMAMMRIEALRYLDAEYLRRNKEREAMPDYQDLCYLYVRSAMLDVPMGADVLAIYRQQLGAIASQWYKCDEIEKAYAAVALYRNGYVQEAHDIINSLREYAVMSANQGMYWPNNRTYSSYRNSAIQVHCAIYEAFELVSPISSELDAMRQWLLLQKQTQAWENVPSTLDAVHILLTSNVEWLQKGDATHISWGETALPEASAVEQIMGYVKCVREDDEVNVSDATITISNHEEKPSWGAIYWQYIDKIADVEAFAQDEIAVERGYYIERDGVLCPVENNALSVGDVVTIRLTVQTQRDMQYMVLSDARPACFEPQVQLPEFNYSQGLYYYSVPRDNATDIFIEYMPRGVYVIEYKVYIDRQGVYQAGVSTIQSYFAPQFTAHTSGALIRVANE